MVAAVVPSPALTAETDKESPDAAVAEGNAAAAGDPPAGAAEDAVATEPAGSVGDSSSAAPPASPLRVLAALGPAVLLVVISLWEVVVIARAGHDTGSESDWQRAAAAVRARHKPGELITFAPRWIDPVGRLHLGDLIDLDMAGRMDADRYGVIWELSIRGARPPETRGLEPAWQQRFGDVTVRRFEREPVRVASDFVKLLSTARRTGGVGRGLEEVGFEPHHCVRLTPMTGGVVKVTYPKVRLGRKLVGYVGVSDVFTRRDFRAPGELRIAVDGKELLAKRVGVRDGWVRFEADTTPAAAATVEFSGRVVGEKRGRRNLCFAAEARE